MYLKSEVALYFVQKARGEGVAKFILGIFQKSSLSPCLVINYYGDSEPHTPTNLTEKFICCNLPSHVLSAVGVSLTDNYLQTVNATDWCGMNPIFWR